ncbi:restriction endonuclease [Mangrovibrevibacter kandeliae]|uniref:restriction endonuclease n=1 Tax=Mangrovibrevibacter kandeliae TaxID=2968473 RepID=UPI0021178137|nr:restriction endonuclease [Aurantimonas sp. CSK15Z-1]MCQ8783113.1 restriction endonuclease [Aurantimonas sp. CSK15Z-1]
MATRGDVPKLGPCIEATVETLRMLGGSASNEEIHDSVVKLLAIPADVAEVPHSNGSMTALAYRLHWARTYLKKVQAVDNSQRGVWTLTTIGRAMSAEEIGDVVRRVRVEDAAQRKARASVSNGDVDEGEGEGDGAAWSERLLAVLKIMRPDAFERLCQRVLREAGFVKVEVTGKSGDGGIDGIGVLRVNLVSFQILFQCKRWQGSVGASTVRDFRGAMIGRADKGLIITTSTFTPDARREATRDGAPVIDLVDGDDLCQLLKDLKIGVTTKLVEEIEIDEAVFAAI